tara:strand:+ start:88 stop:198 length:111 start_codon:yes stop_codon:yes gene_type:complete
MKLTMKIITNQVINVSKAFLGREVSEEINFIMYIDI